MIIRGFSERDVNSLKKIHKDQYENEFSLNEFMSSNYIGSFSALDENENLIATGGVRTIAEMVIVTDKNQSVKVRREALLKMLQAGSFFCKNNNYRQLHAFVQDQVWLSQLLKHGFRETAGQSIVTDISNEL